MGHKNKLILIFAIIHISTAAFGVTKTAVSLFLNSDKTTQAGSTGSYIQNTLAYYISGASGYSVVDIKNIDSFLAAQSFTQSSLTNDQLNRSLAGFFNADLYIYGTYRDFFGKIIIETNIYYKSTGKTEHLSVKGLSGIDLFDTIEELSLSLAKTISGQDIQFSDVEITAAETLTVYIDTIKKGVTPIHIKAGLGEHTLRLDTTAGLTVFKKTITIKDSSPLKIEATIPAITQSPLTQIVFSSKSGILNTTRIAKPGNYRVMASIQTKPDTKEKMYFHSSDFTIKSGEMIQKEINLNVDRKYYALAGLPGGYQLATKQTAAGSTIIAFFMTGLTLTALAPALWSTYNFTTVEPYKHNMDSFYQVVTGYHQVPIYDNPEDPPPGGGGFPHKAIIGYRNEEYTYKTTEGNPYTTEKLSELKRNGDILFYSFLISGITTFSISWFASIINAAASINKTNSTLKNGKKNPSISIQFELKLLP